jgi:hypothetical protein
MNVQETESFLYPGESLGGLVRCQPGSMAAIEISTGLIGFR